jgi:type II secretory pathway component PulM
MKREKQMAARHAPQPKDPATGRFIHSWKWRDARGERSLFYIDPLTEYSEVAPARWWTDPTTQKLMVAGGFVLILLAVIFVVLWNG